MRAHVDHRLDRENVAFFDLRALARRAVVGNLRVFVHTAPDAMPDVVAHDRIAMRFRMLLHRPADVAQVFARATLLDRALQTLFGDANQLQESSSDTRPTGTVVAVSPTNPSSVAPQSIEKMSPSFNS